MQIDANVIQLTLRYLNMARIPGEEVDTFRDVRAQWQAVLTELLKGQPVANPVETADEP